MSTLTIEVCGTPAPQGSKKFVGRAKSGRGIMIESSKAVAPWRAAVVGAAVAATRKHGWEMATGPVFLYAEFRLDRPARPKPEYRRHPGGKPDLDKLLRAVGDALTEAGVWSDDSLVVAALAQKAYSGIQPAGATIIVEDLPTVCWRGSLYRLRKAEVE